LQDAPTTPPQITDSSSSKPYCPRRRWPVRRPPSWLPPGAALSGPRRPRIHVQGQGLLRHQRPPPQGVLGLRGAHRPMGVSTHPSSPLCLCCHTHAVNRNCCLGSYCSNTEIIGQVSANLASHELGQAVRLPDVCCRSGQVS
jgi:hypothetical protein